MLKDKIYGGLYGGLYLSKVFIGGILTLAGVSVLVGNAVVGIGAFAQVNGRSTLDEHISLNYAEYKVFDKGQEKRRDNRLAYIVYTFTIPGRVLGYQTGKFYRNVTTHDKLGMDGWPGNPKF